MKLTKENWLDIAKNYATEETNSIADRLGIRVNQVNSIVADMRKRGIAIPHKGRGGYKNSYVEYVKQNLA